MATESLFFTKNAAESLKTLCAAEEINDIVFLCDTNTEQHCLPLMGIDNARSICINPGELNKNMASLGFILYVLQNFNANRNTVLVNLGGGIISDIGGFAASIFMRGIRFINIPTSLMGMVDAAIGGKTGIDFNNYKNFLGTFSLPLAIIIDETFLTTLPEDELKSAWAEILKIAIISDLELYKMIKNGESQTKIIKAAALKKQSIALSDLHDKNERQLLNFGHTIGHAYESYMLSKNTPLMHGSAVATGMWHEIQLAEKAGFLNAEDAIELKKFMKDSLEFRILDNEDMKGMEIFLLKDKKNTDKKLTFSLPAGIGKGLTGVKLSLYDVINN